MLTVVCENTIMLWVLTTAPKRSPPIIILFILTTLKNEQHPYKRVRVYEDGALTNSSDVKNLLMEELKISMENTGGDASWLNRNNEIHNRRIHNMIIEGLIGSNHHASIWYCTSETPTEVHIRKIHKGLRVMKN